MMACRLCESTIYEEIFHTDMCPKFSHKYLKEDELSSDGYVSLVVLKCKNCGLIQMDGDFPSDEYSTDYQRNISFSKSATDYLNDSVNRLVNKYGVKKIIEIGCGNGFFASAIMKKGVDLVAFEPSLAACAVAKDKGIPVHNLFFDKSLPYYFSGYDSFAIRFVLEHLSNPLTVLKELYSRCLSMAIGLIEVPNAQQQINQLRWFEFFREHSVYFTPATLISFLEKAGFEILEMDTPFNGEFIRVFVRKLSNLYIASGEEQKFKDAFGKLLESNKITWVWGASGGGVSLLSQLNLTSNQIQCVVDSDKNKWGLYTSGSRIKIVSPESLQKNHVDNILILSSAYESEIKSIIRSLGFTGKIGSILPQPRWLED